MQQHLLALAVRLISPSAGAKPSCPHPSHRTASQHPSIPCAGRTAAQPPHADCTGTGLPPAATLRGSARLRHQQGPSIAVICPIYIRQYRAVGTHYVLAAARARTYVQVHACAYVLQQDTLCVRSMRTESLYIHICTHAHIYYNRNRYACGA